MKLILKYKDHLMVAMLMGMVNASAFAQQTLQLNDIKSTSGAGSYDLTNVTDKGQTTAQKFLNFVLIGFAFAGVVLFCFGLYGAYKAGKDEGGRESMKGPIWAMLIGAALTMPALILGYTRNTAVVN
jgi:hypothetical protein